MLICQQEQVPSFFLEPLSWGQSLHQPHVVCPSSHLLHRSILSHVRLSLRYGARFRRTPTTVKVTSRSRLRASVNFTVKAQVLRDKAVFIAPARFHPRSPRECSHTPGVLQLAMIIYFESGFGSSASYSFHRSHRRLSRLTDQRTVLPAQRLCRWFTNMTFMTSYIQFNSLRSRSTLGTCIIGCSSAQVP